MPLGDELLENFNIRALPQSGRVMSPEEEAAEMERMLTEDGEKDDVTAKVVKIVKADIERGKEVNEAESAFRSANYDAYRAKGDGKKERAGHSRIKCSDIMDTIEWMMPSFIKAFAGTADSISISPQNEEDVEKAEKLERLLNWQFMGRHCKGFTVIYEWVKSCLIYGTSVIKITWQDKYIKKGFDLPIATDNQIYQMQGDDMVKDLDGEPQDIQAGTIIDEDVLALANTDPTLLNYIGQVNSQSMQVQPVALDNFRVWRNVHGKKLIKSYSGPLVEVISPEDFYMDPEAKSIEDAQFVIHRVWRTYGYLKEKERDGIYSNVDEVKAWLDRDKESYINSERAQRYNSADAIDPSNYAIDSEDKQIARHKLEVFEWWGLLDLTDEGYQEPYLVVFCGETILRMELNPYGHGQPPFEVLRPMLDPFKFTGVSIPELVGEFQAVKTALFRQILDNVSYQNNGAWLVNRNAGVDINALLNMRPNTIVRSNITSGAVVPLTPPNLQGYPLTMIELVDSMLQKRTGVTSYNQGLDANSLNKMLALDTPIPMADGTVKLNKDVVAGDMVIGSDGKPTEVLEAHPVQMPERAFEIAFGNGDVIRAGGEHLWTVAIRKGKKVFSDFETLPTERIFDILADGEHTAVIPRVKAVEYPEKELILDPYILGAWLGDGNSHTNRFTSMDEEITDRFRKWAGQFYAGGIEPCKQQHAGKATTYQIVKTPFRQMLKDLHCLADSRYEDTKNNVKHIPEEYFTASKEQRLEILRGLMDTDGCRYKYQGRKSGSSAVFCTSNERLMNDVSRLIVSLGGIPKITSREPVDQDGRKYRRHYHISFSMAECPFSIGRKGADWKPNVNTGRVKIISIKEIEAEPMRCISVSAEDRMYCCGKYFTVTRNTATGITKIMDASVQRIELQARVMAETGVKPAFQKILMLNQQFMDQTVVIRVFNKPLEISPDDLIGDFDVSVDVGGATSKNETRVQQMMMLIQSSSLMMSTGVMRPQNLYEIGKKIMEIWEWKDYDKYLSDPNETALIQQALQIIQQLSMSMEQGQVPTPDVIVQAFQQIYNLLLQTLAPNAANMGQNPEGVEQNGGQQQNAGGEFPASTVPRSPVDRAFEQAGAYAGGQRPQSEPVGAGQ